MMNAENLEQLLFKMTIQAIAAITHSNSSISDLLLALDYASASRTIVGSVQFGETSQFRFDDSDVLYTSREFGFSPSFLRDVASNEAGFDHTVLSGYTWRLLIPNDNTRGVGANPKRVSEYLALGYVKLPGNDDGLIFNGLTSSSMPSGARKNLA